MILLFRIAFFTALAGITTLAFLPNYSALPPIVSVSDLANHAVAFFTLFCLYRVSYSHSMRRIVTLLVTYAFCIEIIQAFLPTRYFSLADIVADTTGMIVAIFFLKQLSPHFPLLNPNTQS